MKKHEQNRRDGKQFKQWYNNHQKSFRDKKCSNKTELSKHVWQLKRSQKTFTICLEEKLQIIKAKKQNLLDKITETKINFTPKISRWHLMAGPAFIQRDK